MPLVTTTVGPLYVDDEGGEDGRVSVLWPSLFTDHDMWSHQVDALHEGGWRTLAIDPPGHGKSPGPGHDFSMDDCAEAVVQVLDAIDVRTPVVFLGTSWGGFVGPRLALRAPNRLSGMVLFCTSAESPEPPDRARAIELVGLLEVEDLDKAILDLVVLGMLSPETQHLHPEIGEGLEDQLVAWDRRGVIAAVRSVLVDRESVLSELSQVKTPSLVVSGKEDFILPSVHSQRMVEKLPNARHVEVPGAAHLVPLEVPDEANSLVLDFIQQVELTGSSGTIG
jgi:3-oxoadipate enol-lactonase